MNTGMYYLVILLVTAVSVISEVQSMLTREKTKTLSGPLTNMQFHNDTLYIGAKNKIYALNENLDIDSTVSTCESTKQECDNVNKVLLVANSSNALVSCGTGKGGICEVRNLTDLSHIVKQSTNSSVPYLVVSTDLERPAVGLITSDGKFMIAVTFGNGITGESAIIATNVFSYNYAISTRELTSLNVASVKGKKQILKLEIHAQTINDVKLKLEDYIVYYKKSFQYNGYSYFLTNQKKEVGFTNSSESKLVRICQNDTGYYSYVDIPISCKDGYNLVQDAVLTSRNGVPFLIGVFTKGDDPKTPSGNSVICGEYLLEFHKAMVDARTFFYTKCSGIPTNQKRYLSKKWKQCGNTSLDYLSSFSCDTAVNSFIYVIGYNSLEMEILNSELSFDGTITSLYSTHLKGYHYIVIAGTSTGKLTMMNLKNESLENESLKVYHTLSVDSSKIQSIYQKDDDTLYVMTSNKIAKYVSTNCSEFTTCHSVMTHQNPLCGWCVFENRATRNAACPGNQWLHSFKECINLDIDVHGAPAGSSEDKNVTIKANNLPYRDTGSDIYTCHFTNGGGLSFNGSATRDISSHNFSCKIPTVQAHTLAKLELVVNDIALASVPFLFYKCDQFERCGQCVNTLGAKCTWSLEIPGCINRTSTEINNESRCPRLEDNRGSVFIPAGEESRVELTGSNFPNIASMKYWCYVPKNGTDIKKDVSVPANETGDSITCFLKIDPSNYSKKHEVRIYIKYGKSDVFNKNLPAFDDDYNNRVTVYNCSLLGEECGLCSALNKTRYSCKWCKNTCSHTGTCSPECPKPVVTSVVPYDGPIEGGTSITLEGKEFGSKVEDVKQVSIGGLKCDMNMSAFDFVDDEDFETQVPRKIICTTKYAETAVLVNNEVSLPVKVNVNGSFSADFNSFTYKNFSVTRIKPLKGPKAGGTVITIEGDNLGIGNRNWEIRLGTKYCEQAEVKPYLEPNIQSRVNFTIECVTGNYEEAQIITNIVLRIDKDLRVLKLSPKFEVLPDPEISEIMRKDGFSSGGLPLTVTGKRMTNGNKGTVKLMGLCDKMVPEECTIKSEEVMECYFPKLCDKLKDELMGQFDKDSVRKKRDTCTGCIDVTIVVKLDGIEKSFEIRYFRDPKIHTFYTDKDVLLYGTDQQQLVLKGEYLNLVATKSDFSVTIGIANCTVIELTDKELRCSPPNDQPAPAPDSTKGLPEVNVQIGNIHVTVGYLEYEKKVELLLIIAGAAAGGLVFIFVLILCIVFMKYRKVGRKARQYEKNLSNMEMEIKRVAREEFLDMHTTMSSVNKNLVEQGFPYHSYQQFACNVMFSVDYLWTEPVVSNGKMTDDERTKASKGMESLESLISNKFFLVSVISTMEKEKRFFIREKSNLAGNLCAVLMGKMDYLNEILKLLMTNLVQESSPKKHKTLFRRCESITEKLLSNWMSLCLYPHIEKHSGSPLYLLYMATQKTMESGPIDAVTGDAKHTLSEEKLLKNWTAQEDGNQDLRFEARTLTLNVVVDNGEEIFKCKVLDCDTISQVKSKCLNQIYVNYPASQLPVGANDLALEWHEGFGGILKLRDEDNTSKRDGHWFRLNTLAHYNVKDDSNMALIDPHSAEIQQMEDYANLAQISMDTGCDGSMDSTEPLAPLTAHDQENQHELQHWHLVKKEEESSKQGKSAIAELYLNRLFTTKQSVMEYMRPLFDIILNQDRCPPPTKFLFDFLDELGDRYKVDGDTVHTWKSHSYAIRVWASLMKMPNLLFDVAIPQYMDDNLDIISQVFIESFSLASHKFTKDTPPQKLIFHHEMNDFRDKVKEFYKNVKVNSENADEFRQYMAEVNRFQQQTSFNKVSALYRFYKQLKPYFEDILENLSTSKEASDLQLDRKLEQVIAIMGEGEDEED